ncbi:SsgA family sporulation/cell division regulator [Streptomyces sp. NPDC127077]|uniref:SsgA family sporulation/cell division regulator n=1 Tax=Streptomyces sp. NPDC127077 TaxID=3347131 RepID=UPI0036554A27
MKREEGSAEGIAQAIARIQEAELQAPEALRESFRACLEHLTELQERVEREVGDTSGRPAGLSGPDFATLLERSSLGAPGAAALRARTGAEVRERVEKRLAQLEGCTATSTRPQSDGAREPVRKTLGQLHTLLRGYLEHRRRQNEEQPDATDRSEASQVVCNVGMRLVVSSSSSMPVPTTLRYRSSDPYAIEAWFRASPTELVRWVFSREILAAGLRTSAGVMDVKMRPAVSVGMEVVFITLQSPEGTALLEAPRAALQKFLRQTFDLVAPGDEGQHVDVDELFKLTARSAQERVGRADDVAVLVGEEDDDEDDLDQQSESAQLLDEQEGHDSW